MDGDPGRSGWGLGILAPNLGADYSTLLKKDKNTETNLIEEGAPALGIMMPPSPTCKRDGKQTNLLMPRKSIGVGTPEPCYGKAAMLAKEMGAL